MGLSHIPQHAAHGNARVASEMRSCHGLSAFILPQDDDKSFSKLEG